MPFASEVGFAPGSIDQPFRIGQLNEVIAYAVAILGLNLVVGFSGQLSLGQSAFVGLGAYTTVILVADHGWSLLATLPVSALVSLVVGLAIGVPASRIRGPYLAVATLAMAYVFPQLVLKYESLTGGVNGKGPARGTVDMVPPSWVPFADTGRLAEPLWIYSLLVVVAAVLFLLARNFVHSRPGPRPAGGARQPGQRVGERDRPDAVQGDRVRRQRGLRRPRRLDADAQPAVRLGRPVRHEGRHLPGRRRRGRRHGLPLRRRPGRVRLLLRALLRAEWTYDQSGMPPGLRRGHAAGVPLARAGRHDDLRLPVRRRRCSC